MQMASTVPRIQKVNKRELKKRNELRINERESVFPSWRSCQNKGTRPYEGMHGGVSTGISVAMRRTNENNQGI